MPTAEMRKLQAEMEKLAEQMRPSHEEMARPHAQVDEEMRKGSSGSTARSPGRNGRGLPATPGTWPADEAYREQRKAMQDLHRRHQELAQQYRAEPMKRSKKAAREMREEIQREMQAVREEGRRSMDQRRQIDRQERRERQQEPSGCKLSPSPGVSGKEKPPLRWSSGSIPHSPTLFPAE